ncbi:MAG: sigma-70 family RNA polymerase sigma factor [Bdellovibrionales bacterium]|nr:sigma-70 family RNA polymerase sigma factor [Bdellovibrionales bacterium]
MTSNPADDTEWVRRITRKFTKEFDVPEQDFEELVGIALLGLVEAGERYDPEKGVPFRSYAYCRVRGALLDGMSTLGGLSRSGHRKARALRALTEYREQDEIQRREGASAEVKLAEVFEHAAQAALVHRLSLTAEDGEEMLQSEDASPEEIVEMREVSIRLQKAVRELPETERLVVEEYYFKQKTFEEIGAESGMSKGWISKVHKKAMARMKESLVVLGSNEN